MDENLAVLVTGSMRSGTSSLAGSLKILGLHVPQPEVPASPRNPKGHFEPHWVIRFHKRLLREALTRPSDGSPQAQERIAEAVRAGRPGARAGRVAARAVRAADRGQGPARRLAGGHLGRGVAVGRAGPPAAHRDPAPRRGGRVAGPHVGAPPRRRDAAGQGDLQRRRVAQRRPGHRAVGPRPDPVVPPLRRADRGLAGRPRPGLDAAGPRPRHRPRARRARARRVAGPVAAPLAGLVGRHRGPVLAARPRRGGLGPAQPARRRPAGGGRHLAARRDPRGVRRQVRRGRRAHPRRGPAPRTAGRPQRRRQVPAPGPAAQAPGRAPAEANAERLRGGLLGRLRKRG